MIGTLNRESREATVVGAGVSGLLAAYSLDKAGYEVTLLEAAERAGGLIRTVRAPEGLAEAAAHSVLATAAVQELAEDLGIRLAPVRPDSRARYILRNGKLRKFPLGPLEAIGAFCRAYFVLADRSRPAEELSLDEWARRHVGQAALSYLFTPFVRGIYGADPGDISVAAAFPPLAIPPGHSLLSYQLSRALRGPRKPKSAGPKRKKAMMSPEHGMESLVTALERSLEQRLGSRFRRGVAVDRLPEAPNVLLAVPTDRAAALLEPVEPALSGALRQVRYTPMVAVTVFMENSAFPAPVKGVGVLIPEGEGRSCLGVLFNSSSFPNRVADEARLSSFTMMMGGSAKPEILGFGDDEIRRLVASEMAALFGATAPPVNMVIHRWERAIPQYNRQLAGVWKTAREGWCARPGHLLFGNYSGQVSLRGMIEAALALPQG